MEQQAFSSQYFRITAYLPAGDMTVVMDSYGNYDSLWQFGAMLIQKGFEVLEASTGAEFLDVNITNIETPAPGKIFLRAYCKGRPEYIACELNGTAYRAVRVNDKVYIPNKNIKA